MNTCKSDFDDEFKALTKALISESRVNPKNALENAANSKHKLYRAYGINPQTHFWGANEAIFHNSWGKIEFIFDPYETAAPEQRLEAIQQELFSEQPTNRNHS